MVVRCRGGATGTAGIDSECIRDDDDDDVGCLCFVADFREDGLGEGGLDLNNLFVKPSHKSMENI